MVVRSTDISVAMLASASMAASFSTCKASAWMAASDWSAALALWYPSVLVVHCSLLTLWCAALK
jgi:hypothetical protein